MKTYKKLITIIATVLVLIIGGGAVYATNTPTARAERQLNLGNKYLQEGKYQEAILAFQKVITIESKNIPARLGLGKVYVATKEFTKAEAVLKEVIQIDVNNIPAREDLLKVYLKEGNLDSANTILQEMIKIDPKKDVKQFNTDLDSAKAISDSKASYDQGITQMNRKLYLESMASLQKVIKEDTERYSDAQQKIKDAKTAYITQQLQVASDLVKATKYDDAIKILDEILKIDATNEDAINLKDQCTQAIAKAIQGVAKAKTDANSVTLQSDNDKQVVNAINKAIDNVVYFTYKDLPGENEDYRVQHGLGHINAIPDAKYNLIRNGIPYLEINIPRGFNCFINLKTYDIYSSMPRKSDPPTAHLVRGPIPAGKTFEDWNALNLPVIFTY